MKNCTTLILLVFIFGCKKGASQDAPTWQLVWSDEFNEEGTMDPTKWLAIRGDGCPSLCGWGNNELEYYRDGNKDVWQEGGLLHLNAQFHPNTEHPYTSAKITSLENWLYGKIEVRAKLPGGRGTWPAIWMLPQKDTYGGWPKSGEIDIMEYVGYNPNWVVGTVHTEAFNHTKGTQKSGTIETPTAEQEFHVYSIEWTADKIDFFLDEQLYFTFQKRDGHYSTWPFDQKFYIIINLAIGGDWGGLKGIDDSIFPQQLQIDYVRVYQK